ncbi:MAG TPA: RNA methyltransferase [Thermoanaerobaculia bacterium]|nr:RNA methyltransferase [Thermoanaerobaculia bacterium]
MIRSRDNARLKDLRKLGRDRRWREEKGEGLLEGPHLIAAALEAGLLPISTFATAAFLERQDPLLARLPTPPHEVDSRLLDELADADSPRGIVASIALPSTGLEEWLVRASDALRAGHPIVAVDRLQDPGNLGALARVAEAAGAALLALAPGTVDWRHPRALRASTGSLLRLPVVEGISLPSLRAGLAASLATGLAPSSPLWIGLSPRNGVPLWETAALPEQGPVGVVVGSEGEGMSEEALSVVDRTVTIPMAAPVESINVTAAAAVVLFELVRRRGGP